ncbi:MAG: acyltransferase [Bacteroidia bacterium]|jgi:peptidoglycan/LPS O-acetylase OafA/YrhL|nr:acyltransferase [Bacteroidia bacterium]
MRIATLDYLRGLAAFGIMIYHYLGFKYGKFDVANPLEKIGFYGVSIFYVLSGLTLYSVYNKKELNTISTWKEFYLKRIFRIFPLLWVAIILTLVLSSELPETNKLILNFTGLFGFINWNSYIAMGSWSIGNELVFYSLFPLILYLIKKVKYGKTLVSFLAIIISIYFSYFILDSNVSIYDQWRNYTNPINQIPFFMAGILIGAYSEYFKTNQKVLNFLLIILFITFFIIPVQGNAIIIVSGYLRLVYFTICILITFILYQLSQTKYDWIHKPLFFIGETSYGIYLYHPIVFIVVKRLLLHISPNLDFNLKIILSIIITLMVSFVSYKYMEKPISGLAKKLSNNN